MRKGISVRLPNNYFKYADVKLSELSKEKKERIAVNFTAYQACKLEQWAVKAGKTISDLFKEILVDNGILDKEDVVFSKKRKFSSKFLGKNCEELKGIKTSKIYHFDLSEYAKAKLYKNMLEMQQDLSYYIKTRMLKEINKDKDYAIFDKSDLAY